MKLKERRNGFEIEAELVAKIGKKTFREPFPIKVNSLNVEDIQSVIDFWRNYLKEKGDSRKIVVKNVYRVEQVKFSEKSRWLSLKPD